jgi:hypothetical protein
MIALLRFLLTLLVSPFRSKSRLEAKNAALRHQLIVLQRRVRGRVQLTNGDRLFLVQLYRRHTRACERDSRHLPSSGALATVGQRSGVSLPPPTLGECRHCGLARLSIAVAHLSGGDLPDTFDQMSLPGST